ncbi:hypothetical protein [Xanthomonas campestris]|uniref:hypothetical protein n=1 Tax=Xanthomonas campestris TaxID=339 RepID=UPI001E3AF763|nr:hypothetical protein [Xanthomonas campestris]MCC4606026.1 hypothetical protein [Xanthomonas campestris pv. parthenii]
MANKIFYFILLAATSFSVQASQKIEVKLSVTCSKPTSLLLSIKNITSTPIPIPEAALPWNNSKSIYIEAFKISNGKSLKLVKVAPIADYLRTITLAPQKRLGGEIYLNRIFANFDRENESADILIFYRIKESKWLSETNFNDLSGTIMIPKKGFFSHPCPIAINPTV